MQLIHLAASLAIAAASPLMTERAACADYVLIQARGTGENPGPTPTFANIVAWTLGNVTNGANYNVVYPADITQNAGVGADDAIRFINAQRAICPQQRFALLGYSQGASVVDNIIQRITGTAIEPLVVAVVPFGNPYQVPNQSITIDENGGSKSRGGFGLLYFTNIGLGFPQHWVDSGKIQQVCYFGDHVCDTLSAFGPLDSHLKYVNNTGLQVRSTQFLVSKLKK